MILRWLIKWTVLSGQLCFGKNFHLLAYTDIKETLMYVLHDLIWTEGQMVGRTDNVQCLVSKGSKWAFAKQWFDCHSSWWVISPLLPDKFSNWGLSGFQFLNVCCQDVSCTDKTMNGGIYAIALILLIIPLTFWKLIELTSSNIWYHPIWICFIIFSCITWQVVL